jgi:hydroxymethylglutaryl-CoA lyase
MMDIEIIEVGPRDGLQNQATVLSTSDKLSLIFKLYDAGARRIEIASFVNPRLVPQMADAEDVVSGFKKSGDVTTIGLVLNEPGLSRAVKTSIDEIGIVVAASDAFGVRNQKQTSAESVAMARSVIAQAKAANRSAQVTISVAFGCPFEGEVPAAYVAEMARELATAEPREIALADTIGVAVPGQVKLLIAAVKKAVPGMPLRCHFHNTRNTGIANAWAAVECGVSRLDSSVGGIGGCPFAPAATGNIATEDLIYVLERSGLRSGYDLQAVSSLAPWLAHVLKLTELPAMVSRAGGFPKSSA